MNHRVTETSILRSNSVNNKGDDSIGEIQTARFKRRNSSGEIQAARFKRFACEIFGKLPLGLVQTLGLMWEMLSIFTES